MGTGQDKWRPRNPNDYKTGRARSWPCSLCGGEMDEVHRLRPSPSATSEDLRFITVALAEDVSTLYHNCPSMGQNKAMGDS